MRPLVATVTALVALLVAAADASANFVYWANQGGTSIGRAKINGTGANNAFIGGLTNVQGVAVDSNFIYWTQGTGATSSIGRANLDGSGANPNFIPNSSGAVDFDAPPALAGIAVNSSSLFWNNTNNGTMGSANVNGTAPNGALFVTGPGQSCGVAADQNFVYWLDNSGAGKVGRATTSGSSRDPSFITGLTNTSACGLAVDPDFLYWDTAGTSIGRAPVGGGGADNGFILGAVTAPNKPCGVASNSQYIFWGNTGASNSIGRANLNGGSPNQALITVPTTPCLMAAAPSNKITIDSIAKKTSKGTAIITARVSGPGQVTMNQVSTPPDVNATAAAVKEVGLTITQASSFQLPVKPVGKTAKKMNKQIKKQLRKKHKAKATAKQTVFIHFIPSGVAGVPNTQQVSVTLVKTKRK
jgi:hypothetical protein